MPTLARPLKGLLHSAVLAILFSSVTNAEIVSDDFNNGTLNPAIWTDSQGVIVRGAGEDGFLDGHALWFGAYGARRIETRAFNTLGGGTVNFSVRTGDGTRPWWDRMSWWRQRAFFGYQLPGDETWHVLRAFSSRSSYWRSWRHLTVLIPPAARSYDTRFAFWQGEATPSYRDHWAVDNVIIETIQAGTTWSHPLPAAVSILKGRIDSSGQYLALLKASGPFRLGSFPGVAGIYLVSVGENGDWDVVTPLSSADPNANYYDMTVDDVGNVIVCGSYTDPVFGLPSSTNSPNAFVAKFSSTHQLLWARAGFNLASSEAHFRGLCVGSSGEITVAGRFHQFMRFGPAGAIGEPELSSAENDSSLLVRYDSAGNYQWSRRLGELGNTDPDVVWGMRCDPTGNLYVYGRYFGTLKLSDAAIIGEPAGPSTPSLGFLAKLSSAGGVQWLSNLGFSSEVRGVAVDANGLFATGLYDSAIFDPTGTPVAPDPSMGVFLSRVDPANGSVLWAKTCTSAGDDFLIPGECLGLDQSGRSYLAHTFEGDSTVAGQFVSADPGFNILVTRWNTDGSLNWHKRAGSGTIATLANDEIGQVFLSGQAEDLAAFESNAVLADPAANYLHKFNNIFDPTAPVGVYVLRSGIPASTPDSASLGELIAKDTDATGTYSFAFAEGVGDTHNSFFTIGGTSDNELLLADGLLLVPGDQLSLRMQVSDENTNTAESMIKFTVGPPTSSLWASSFGSATVNACTSGPNGELYVIGFFLGTLEFGPWSVTSRGSADFFIAKFDSNGDPAWILRGGSTALDRGLAIDVDSAGNCYACGNIGGDTSISKNGGGNIADFGAVGIEFDDLWVASFSEDGNFRWLATSGGSNTEFPSGITHDEANDRTYVTGYFRGTTDFGGYALRRFDLGSSGAFTGPSQASVGGQDAFVARYDGTGVFQWVRFGTGTEDIAGNAVAVDSTGVPYVTGRFKKHANFNGTAASTPDANTAFPTNNAFLWKLLTNGSNAWLRHGGVSNNNDEGLFVGIDANNRITMAGRSFGSNGTIASFSGTSLTISDGWDPVLVTYDSTGMVQSGHIFHKGFQDDVQGFEVFPNGSILFASDVSEMDDVALPNPVSFLQLDSAGALAWSDALAPALDCAAFSPDFAPHAVGSFSGSVEVAGEVLTTGSNYAARLVGPVPASAPPSSLTLGAPQPSPLPGGPQPAQAPFDAMIDENVPVGSLVAPLTATDPDSSSLAFQLTEGDGDDDNRAFVIDGANLITDSLLNFEERSEYHIRIRVVDETRETLEMEFVIGVGDLPDSIPATITLADLIHVFDGQPHGATAITDPIGVALQFTYDGSSTEPTGAGPYALVAQVDHPDYSGSDAADTFWIRSPIQNWLAAFFPVSEIDDPAKEATVWGDLADPDHDQIPNNFEGYYGTNPATPNPPAQVFRTISPSPTGDHVITWQRSKTPVAGIPHPQWSLDLVTWFNSGEGPFEDTRSFVLAVDADLGENEVVSATLPRGNERAIFIRLAFP